MIIRCVQSMRGTDTLQIYQLLPSHPDTPQSPNFWTFLVEVKRILWTLAQTLLAVADHDCICMAGFVHFWPSSFLFMWEERHPEALWHLSISMDTLMLYVYKPSLSHVVKNKIKDRLPGLFAFVFNGWSGWDTHFVSVLLASQRRCSVNMRAW